jgi:hypothetical protein
MKKLTYAILLVSLLMVLPTAALANSGKPPMDIQSQNGWTCIDVGDGDYHCFDPGDAKSKNVRSLNVRVFTGEGEFLGTETLWHKDIYAGQPCPQSMILTPEMLGMPFYACHHYSH